MTYKLVALDVDGTIRDTNFAISSRTKDVVAKVRAAGALVTLATGRSLHSAVPFATELGLDGPIINSQGALITDVSTRRAMWHKPMTLHMVSRTLKAMKDYQLQVLMFFVDEVCVEEMTPWAKWYGERTGTRVRAVGDLRKVEKRPTRLVVVGDEKEMGDVYKGLKGTLDSSMYVTRSLPIFCEILHPEGGKAKALSWLCKWAGVSAEDCIAFGNGPDDVDMIRWAGKGVAMESSPPELLAVADAVAASVEENGPAQILEEMLANGQIGG